MRVSSGITLTAEWRRSRGATSYAAARERCREPRCPRRNPYGRWWCWTSLGVWSCLVAERVVCSVSAGRIRRNDRTVELGIVSTGTAKRVMLVSITIGDIQRAAETAGISYAALLTALKVLDQLPREDS